MAPLTTTDLADLVGKITALAPATGDAERIDRIRHFEQLKAAVSAAQMSVAVELAESRHAASANTASRASDGRARDRRAEIERGVAAEVALARRVSPAQARRWLGLARILQSELPATFAKLATGRTSEWRAMLVARETIFLSREHRGVVDADLAERLEQLGDRKIEAEARRAAQRLDPAGAAERARNAARDRRVSLRPAPDTMCWLSALLPVAQGVAAYAALKRHADTVIGTGEQRVNADGSRRGHGQVMADTLVERITGQANADDVPVEINLVMTDTTLFQSSGCSDAPAEPGIVLGYGPVPAPTARELALGRRELGGRELDSRQPGSRQPDDPQRVGRRATRWIRRLYVTPDRSQLIDIDTRRREFTPAQRQFVRLRDHDTCRTPWCNAPVRHLDHVNTWADTGRTSVRAAQGYCEACNYVKQAPGWRTSIAADGVTITTVTPAGHSYPSPMPAPPGAPPPRSRSSESTPKAQRHPPDSPVEARLRQLLRPAA